ncbi:AT-rich interactive domain-containing protein 4B isoform X2 [Parasteatoda tepidariorum]|uniref:AT-rich interactive domain-containing protein 4B isoform X2 n=1 Tax=Parasteatoda tepidariorum TaxID=114398 RepID=UPI001C71A12C|nr:AT-rich interactive domain-containing protein 4A isoform X2 [Parasteatoda tepidariorum]
MAADEPPFLTIGTDVSAKYKGAFCEAKVKKVNKIVKCKVTFKNNLGSFVVTDDLIRTGNLRIGADVEAKHPDKNGYYEAVINKLQDYSQYTVVFDDGDETTLRRTSLCLKSGRHFAESPTLDQFPLTNPEHFGTPVIGSGKFKRKRRSTVNSSLDYESSDDEDSLPRKLKAIRGKERDPDLGKVVCVDYGDRRKKDNWYPGLIVPLPPQSNIKILKEEHLIRSFKDGKYYQVPKRDIREFTKECGQKVENNALRSAVEKATLYLEKEELPPHWDKVLFIGLEDDESNEFESDTSDDEPSEEKDRFVAQLYKFMDERGTPINKAPTVSNRDLNLYKLFKIMHKLGGYNKVTNKNKWKTVYSKMGLPHSVANGPNQVKFAYKRYLQSFEDFYRKLGCTMVNNTRSTRGRHRSDRNIIITRTRERDAASPKSKANKETKEKSTEKKGEEKPKPADKKESKIEENSKSDKIKNSEKKKLDDDKGKKEEKRKLSKKDEDSKPEKARTREDARKEKNDSPEKKGTRSSLKIEADKKPKEETTKEKKIVKEKKDEKLPKEEKPKPKKEEITKDKKLTREKKVEEKVTKEKRENPVREKRELSREKKEIKEIEKPKGKKEDSKPNVESPKRKLERSVKKDLNKLKVDDTECKEEEKKEESAPVVEQPSKKTLNEEEIVTKLEDISVAEDRKSKQIEDEPPNKSILEKLDAITRNLGKKKSIKGDEKEDKESLFEFSDSDDLTNDSEKASGKDLKKEIEVGDRVKVKYGRGRMQKVYEAKVLKTETDGLEKRYYVHYAGWNMRYDEWVRKNYIVAIVNGNKKFEGASKNSLPPSSMKKQERSRLPGLKSVRKISTSSSNSNVSRTTRSDKKEDVETKTKSTKGSAVDASQESDSEREEDEDVDVQIDCCFKEELFSDDEKEKLDEAKEDSIAELDKVLEPIMKRTDCSSNDAENFASENKLSPGVKMEENLKIDSETDTEKGMIHKLLSDCIQAETPLVEDRVVEELQSQSAPSVLVDTVPDDKPQPSPEEDVPQPMQTSEVAINKQSVLSFSGLIRKTESPAVMEPPLIFSEPADTSSISEIEMSEQQVASDIKIQNSETNEETSLLSSGKTDCLETNDSVDSVHVTETSLPCSEIVNDQTEVSSPQNIFVPSFSPQNVDNKLRSDDNIISEAVDVSKMIPGILERLKNDVVNEFDQKNELPFDFLRESSNKCMSRSDSSSSLRICESDTNDSNNDSKDVGFKLSPTIQVFNALSKCNTENELDAASKVLSTESSEKSNEGESVVLSTDVSEKSTSNSELISSEAVEIASIKEQTLNVENNVTEGSCVVDNEDTNSDAPVDNSLTDFLLTKSCDEANSLLKDEVAEDLRAISSDSLREIIDSAPSNLGFCSSTSQEPKAAEQNFDLCPSKEDDNIKNISFTIKKEGKKKKFSKKFGKKSGSELLLDKDSKMNKNRAKKKMRFGGFSCERMKSLDMKSKSKKLKKNKNKKRFKHEDVCETKKMDGDDVKDIDKVKKKEKKKCDKKLLKCSMKSEDGSDVLKKKKIKKNREKLLGKDFCEKKAKKKRKLPLDHGQDTDSDKDTLPKMEKKRKKKKPKTKGCSSSDDDKFFKEETLDVASSSSIKQEDPDMSFLLCEENVPASPVDIANIIDDSSDSSSMEENSSGLLNINNTSTVMDNTPPTTPSSTESLLSSSPSHERDSFPYPESTQSGRESCEGEGDIFRCGSNRTISRGSEEYHAATTLAFDVCQSSVAEKLPPSSDLLKQQPKSESIDHQLTKRKKKSKRFRRMSETTKSPKHKLSFLRTSKVEHYYEESSGTSLATLSSSPPYGSLSFSKSLPSKMSPTSEEMIHVPLHEKDPEKRIALLQKKMSELRKHYLSLRAEVIAIDHKRRKARKKIRETVGSTTAPSPHSDEGQSCS